VKWKLEIEIKLLEKNGIRIEIEIFFKMEITLRLTLTFIGPLLCNFNGRVI